MELQCDHGPTGPAKQDGEWVPAGVLLRAHGVHGAIRVRLDISSAQLLKPLDVVRIVPRGGVVSAAAPQRVAAGLKDASRLMHVTHVRDIHDAALVTFKELPSREAAQLWHGATLEVPQDVIPPMDDEAAYMYELAGSSVRDATGADLGTVERVDDNGGQALLVISYIEATRGEVPAEATRGEVPAEATGGEVPAEATRGGVPAEATCGEVPTEARKVTSERLLPLVGETFVSFCRETKVLTVSVPEGLWE